MYTLVLSVVAVASQQLGTSNTLSQDDVIAVLANSFAAHQNRLAGRGDAFEPTKIAVGPGRPSPRAVHRR